MSAIMNLNWIIIWSAKLVVLNGVFINLGPFAIAFKLDQYVVVSTTSGDIKGYVLDIAANNVVGSSVDVINMFLGIPYAEPPVGNLRFARPVARRPWSPSVHNALGFSPSCPQPPWFLRTYSFPSNYSNYNEDCLYLNIYSPKRRKDPNATYPVLFWIHGGAYKYGSGAEYDGRILAQEGVIVVTINYRLGALGFLSSDDDVAPGNYGLLDQLTALKWVKDNIASFHGDPGRITLFGQSAGGGSVSLHMFSQKARGLFNSLIPQSGCALSPWAIYRPPHSPRTYAMALATSVDCLTTTSSDMITCLRSHDADKLASTSVAGPPMIAAFAPRVDGYYITDLPEKLLSRGEYINQINHVNIMTGYLPQEVAEDLEGEPGIDEGLTRTHLTNMFRAKSSRYLDNADRMFDAMMCAYPPSGSDVTLNREYAIDMNSDYGYVVPHIKLSEHLSEKGEHVWLYVFTYRSPSSLKKAWIGVPHAEELYYVFGAPFLDISPCPGSRDVTCPVTWANYQAWSAGDKDVSRATIKLWADFAKLHHYSNTFVSTATGVSTWPKFTSASGETFLDIRDTITPEQLHKTRGQLFWGSYDYLNLSAPIPDVCGQDSGILVGK